MILSSVFFRLSVCLLLANTNQSTGFTSLFPFKFVFVCIITHATQNTVYLSIVSPCPASGLNMKLNNGLNSGSRKASTDD